MNVSSTDLHTCTCTYIHHVNVLKKMNPISAKIGAKNNNLHKM